MISDSIEIESKKDNKSAIHYILNVKEKYIEQKPTDKKRIGTSIKLKLHNDYVKKLEIKPIEQIIEENMAYQPIPITLKVNNQQDILLNKSKIELPENYELAQTSEFIEFDDNDELEGYIVLSKGHGEQQLFGNTKIAQQYFVITGNGTNINLSPSWLRQSKFNINIPDKYKIQLKASRTKIELEDENLLKVKDFVLDKIIQKFEELVKIHGIATFFQYADDGRGRQVKYTEKEYSFLINLPLFQVIDIKNTTSTINFLQISFKDLMQQIKKNEKIAVIRNQYLQPQYKVPLFVKTTF
jgi:HSP90 family molecular chaperone